MKTFLINHKLTLLALAFLASADGAIANPSGMSVVAGSATAQQIGSQLNVAVSQLAVLNWNSFNIAANETTSFLQPSANSVVLNVIGSANPSQIFGSLTANGTVILENANGFYFGPNSMINVGGSFIATTAPLTPDFGTDGPWQFTGTPPAARIINYGQIEVGQSRSLFLIAENIQNNGTLTAPGGNIGLAAGQDVLVSDSPDGRGLSATVQLPSGSVNNLGQITADAGTIALQAQVVNQNGLIQADSIQSVNGTIELLASSSVALGANSAISAMGDSTSTSPSAGGSVQIQAGDSFSDQTGSSINVSGAIQGGNGGQISISAPQMSALQSTLNAQAAASSPNGTLSINTTDIALNSDGSPVADALALDANSLSSEFSRINLQASDDITVSGQLILPPNGGVPGVISLLAENEIMLESGAEIEANGGSITLNAPTVDQAGTLQADSVGNANGVIEIDASQDLILEGTSLINAEGDPGDVTASPGGFVVLNAGNTYSDTPGSAISASGNAAAGQGGVVEIFDPQAVSTPIQSTVSGAFEDLANPYNITISSAATSTSYDPNNNLDATFKSSNLAAYSQIDLHALDDISINSAWTLPNASVASAVSLIAGNDINLNSSITADYDWNINLTAGLSSSVAAGAGDDGIYFSGTSSLQAENGDIDLVAGQSILVSPLGSTAVSGSIFTTEGGSIFADAIAGDISAGTSNGGTKPGSQTSDYQFKSSGANPNAVLGGISTQAGGNVTLIAGDDVVSIPTVPANQWPGASGTYGSGNVTIIAGNEISGNYNLANGTGILLAGIQLQPGQSAVLQDPQANPATYDSTLSGLEAEVTQTANPGGNIGDSSASVTLSLIQGSWNAWAADDIYLNEVNNPNGSFNTVATGENKFLFNYGSDAAANFWAGNAIDLVGTSLARTANNLGMPPIYAPDLSLNAGAGGITVDASIFLYPSSEGSLQIVTRDGGDLTGAAAASSTSLIGITMSDAGPPGGNEFYEYQAIQNGDHASTPIDLDNPNPVTVDISGSIESFGLTVPTFAQINVVGDTYNFGFIGQNLSASQTTYINVGQTAKTAMENLGLLDPVTDGNLVVGGSITYRGDLTSETLSSAISAAIFDVITADNPSLAGALSYDVNNGQLSFVGVMSSGTEQSLLNPTDINGNPLLSGSQLTAWQTTIAQLYNDSQTASLGDNGLTLSGPGNFTITASSIDLGISGGIIVAAPDAALAAISPDGANIIVNTTGDLEMTTTTIANDSFQGGITLNVGDTLDVGNQLTAFGDPGAALGIFTAGGGNISVTANNDVNVDGSRIAAYDGGNITVDSLNGDVNAGTGGEGYVTLAALELDPSSGDLDSIAASIPGSGILATTVPYGIAPLGNITVTAPNGDINASLGGIIQIAFNGNQDQDNFISLTAGGDINATGSGIIGSNIKLQAGGDIAGVVIGSQSVNIDSAQDVNVTAVSGGNVDINASGNVSGTIVSGGNLDVSGNDINASLISESVSASGDTTGASMGVPQSNVSSVTTQTADNATEVTAKTDDATDDDDQKKKRMQVALAQKTSRVTVTLPRQN